MKTKSLPLNTKLIPSAKAAPQRSFSGLQSWVALFFFLLALVPLARTCYVVASTGADCISNDDIMFLSLTENMLSGSYDWRNYFQDTFINGHCSAAAQALLMLLGPFVAWNQYLLCSLGILLALVRTHITARFLCASAGEKFYWPVFALVSWMLFSYSQISLFTTGIFSIVWQSCLLFTTLGAYLLWRNPERISAAIASSVLGVLACWNLAVGLPAWIVYLSIVLLRGAKKRTRMMIVSTGMAIASIPYLTFLISGASHSRKLCDQYVLWFNPPFIINALGRTFANDIGHRFGVIPSAMLAGAVGIIGFALFAFVMIRSARMRQLLLPPFILTLWSLSLIGMIGVFRFAVAPWYALIAALFWSALSAASIFAISLRFPNAQVGWSDAMRRPLIVGVPSLLLLLVASWTCQYNKSYLDKQYFLENRSPVSASVLRNYEIAPEAFSSYVFKLHALSTVVTGKMLERNRWSVFSPNPKWEMQGDSIFSLSEGYPSGVSLTQAQWIKSTDEASSDDFRSPEHLNLCLVPGGSAHWRIALPQNAKTISLRSSVALSKRAASFHEDSVWSIAIAKGTNRKAEAEETAFTSAGSAKREWQAVGIDLSEMRGAEVDIQFRNSSADSAIVFEYPILELQLSKFRETGIPKK